MLLLDGPDIHIKNLRVDGALMVRAVPGARVVIDGLTVSNAGWSWTPTEEVRGCCRALYSPVGSETAVGSTGVVAGFYVVAAGCTCLQMCVYCG